jgi:signal transduction histidine kinase
MGQAVRTGRPAPRSGLAGTALAGTALAGTALALGGAVVAIGALVWANARLRRERAALRARADQAGEAAMMISHDLAQPLASAASLAELLAVDWPGLSEQDRRELAVNIDRSVQRLIAAINEHLPRLRRAVQPSAPAESEVTGRR